MFRSNTEFDSVFSQIPAVTYHKIVSAKEVGLNSLSPGLFDDHLKILRNNGFTAVTTASPEADKSVLLTFDDGYESVYHNAKPILEKYNFPAVVFVICNYIGKDNEWDINFGINRFRHLDHLQLKELHSGGWEIASHGCHHRSYTGLTSSEILKDLTTSKKYLEDLTGACVQSFTPPFNAVTPNLYALVEEAGYNNLFLQEPFTRPDLATKLNIIYRRMIYNFDKPANVIRKISSRSRYELFKENVIHFCSNATIAVKELV